MSDDERGEADETQTTSDQSTDGQGAGDGAGSPSEPSGSSSGSPDSSDSSDSSDGPQLEASAPGDIGDDNLPEDLQPTEDNPLARHPEQTGDDDDTIGADREEDPETAPLKAEDADYGHREDSSGSSPVSGSDSGPDSSDSPDASGGDGPGDGRAKAQEDDGSDTLDNGGGGAG